MKTHSLLQNHPANTFLPTKRLSQNPGNVIKEMWENSILVSRWKTTAYLQNEYLKAN